MKGATNMVKEKQRGLGKGLDNIFGSDVGKFLEEIQSSGSEVAGTKHLQIKIDEIRANPYQPRKEFDQNALKELAASIREHGVFTPVLVRKSVQGYELIAGERRLRASKLAGLTEIPAIQVEFTDEQMMEISLLENIQRENLNPIEEALAFESLIKRLGYTQEKLAQRVGKSREYCANMLRLLKLPADVKTLVVEKKLSMGHVRPLLSLKDENQMYDAAMEILDKKMSVREVEAYIKTLSLDQQKPKRTVVEKDKLVVDLEKRLQSKLGTKVAITNHSLTIKYTNTKDLNRILEILGCIEE